MMSNSRGSALRGRLRPLALQVHRWTGLLAGLYILVVSTSGAALVFRLELQQALDPQLFPPTPSGPLVNPLAVIDSVAAAFPGWRVSGVEPPTTARSSYLAYVVDGSQFETVLIDPATARVLGTLPQQSLVRTLQSLHYDLLAGRRGRVANGIGALALIVMCVSGLVVWWPRTGGWRRALAVPFDRGAWPLLRELHGLIGALTVAFTLMWAITGAYFAFPSAFRAAISWVSPLSVSRAPTLDPPTASDGPEISLATLIDTARRTMPGLHVARVVLPSSARAPLLVMFAAASPTPAGGALAAVYLDPRTGAVVEPLSTGRSTLGDALIAWIPRLHIGTLGGWPVKATWAVVGLCPPLLFLTGLAMWWIRAVRPRRFRT